MKRRAGSAAVGDTTVAASVDITHSTLNASDPSVRRVPRTAKGQRALRVVLGSLLVVALLIGNQWLKVAPLWRWQHDLLAVNEREVTVPDALVVLGYSVDHATREPTGPLTVRLQLAVDIACRAAVAAAQEGASGMRPIQAVIFTGGSAPRIPLSQPTEAEVMSEVFSRLWDASQCGNASEPGSVASLTGGALQQPRHILELYSTSTLENARYTLALLLREYPTLRHLQLVTNRFHQRRSLLTFRGVEAQRARAVAEMGKHAQGQQQQQQQHAASQPSPVPFTFSIAPMPADLDSTTPQLDFVREVGATLLYMARRWI